MPDPQDTPQNTQQIEGLPPGAVLKPIQQSAPQIEGLPPGAVLKPIQGVSNQPTVTNSAGETIPANQSAAPEPPAVNVHPGFHDPRGQSYARAAEEQAKHPVLQAEGTGFFKEAGKTISGLSNLLTGGHGWNPPPESMETRGIAEGVGGLVEQGVEWASGDAVLEGGLKFLKVAKNYPHLIDLIENYPKAAKILMAGGKGAAVGGAEGAVKESASGGKGAVEGGKEGAEGGAIGGAVGETIGMVAKPIAKAFGIGTSSEEDISKAAQFAKNNLDALKDWSKAQKPIAEAFEATGAPKTLTEGVSKISEVRKNYWKQITDIADKHADEPFDATNVASAVRKLADNPAMKRFPEDQKFLTEFANKYTSGSPEFSGEAKVSDAMKEIKKYNAKLDKEGYWKQPPEKRAAMEEADPKIAAWRTASNELRESLFKHLSDAGEPNMAELRETYGAIGNIERSLRGQINVTGRAKNISLKKALGVTIGLAHGGPAGMAAASFPVLDAIWNDPVRVLNRAVSKSSPGSAQSVVQQVAKAVAPAAPAAKNLPAIAGENFVLMLNPSGQPVQMHPDDVAKAKQMGYKQVESSPENK